MKTFSTLYKKSASTGKISQWEIFVEDNLIIIRHGQVGGKIQETTDEIRSGKNLGKANATTPEEQAEAEAISRYEKQLKRGYVKTIDDAQAGKTDEMIKGGISPMLAKEYSKYSKRVKYPCIIQPKLDGIRCIAIIKDGVVTLWSRSRKQILSVPHINKAFESLETDGIYDGELYNHNLRDDFEELCSKINRPIPFDGHEMIQYHCYDLPIEGFTTKQRMGFISMSLNGAIYADRWMDGKVGPIVQVESFLANNEEKANDAYIQFLDDGYEGAMYRDLNSHYEFKRSLSLLKRKEWMDEEFVVVGIEEGAGNLKGHAATAVCKMPDGQIIKPTFKTTREKKREYFLNPPIGKLLTVRFQDYTKYGIPRFMRGIRLREEGL